MKPDRTRPGCLECLGYITCALSRKNNSIVKGGVGTLDTLDAKGEKKPENGLFSSSSGASAEPSLGVHERPSSTNVEERPSMQDTSEDPNIKHLKKMAETQLQRTGYMTRTDFFNFMYEAGHQNQDVVSAIVKRIPGIKEESGGFRWVGEDKT